MILFALGVACGFALSLGVIWLACRSWEREQLSNTKESAGILAAFEDLRTGRVRSLAEIDPELEGE